MHCEGVPHYRGVPAVGTSLSQKGMMRVLSLVAIHTRLLVICPDQRECFLPLVAQIVARSHSIRQLPLQSALRAAQRGRDVPQR